MSETLQTCCRICLDLETEHVSILHDSTIQDHIKACLPTVDCENDNFPKSVCTKCVSTLREFYNFQINAKYSQVWLESNIKSQSQVKKGTLVENKTHIQPIADSEYNSDSLLEFLDNTENVEDYLSSLGNNDINLPSIVNFLDKQSENSVEFANKLINSGVKVTKITSTKSNEEISAPDDTYEIHMEIDVLDSDADIVNEILMKESFSNTTYPDVDSQKRLNVSEKNAYACLACKSKFDDLTKLTGHMAVCDTATRTCFQCGLQFDSKQKMLKHRLTHGLSPLKSTCNCGKKFSSRDRLLQHYEKCHNDFVAAMGCVYRCKECGDIFHDRFELYKHARNHVVRRESCVCDQCGRCFSTASYLATHKQKEHVKGEVQYRCKVCGLTSADRRQLYLHVKQHAAVLMPQQHLCDACGRSFTTMAALSRHAVTHVGARYRCRHCQKECIDDAALARHLAVHERESAVCEYCGATFLKYDFLQKHLKEHT